MPFLKDWSQKQVLAVFRPTAAVLPAGQQAACDSDCVTQQTLQHGVLYCQHTAQFHGKQERAAPFTTPKLK